MGNDKIKTVSNVLSCDRLGVDCGHLLGILIVDLAGKLFLCSKNTVMH